MGWIITCVLVCLAIIVVWMLVPEFVLSLAVLLVIAVLCLGVAIYIRHLNRQEKHVVGE